MQTPGPIVIPLGHDYTYESTGRRLHQVFPKVFVLLKFDFFVSSAWSFVFSSPPQRPMTSDYEGFSIPDFIHYIYFPILILEKEPVFSLSNVQ